MMDQTTCAPRRCKKCGKEIENGKYCGVCQAEVREQNKKFEKCGMCAFMGVITLAGKKVIWPATKKVAKAAAQKVFETMI